MQRNNEGKNKMCLLVAVGCFLLILGRDRQGFGPEDPVTQCYAIDCSRSRNCITSKEELG